jgi:hypothetical protein
MILLSARQPVAPPAEWSLIAHAATATNTTPPIDTSGADLLIVVAGNFGGMGTAGPVGDSKENSWVLGIESLHAYESHIYWCAGGIVGPGHTFNWTGSFANMQVLAMRGAAPAPADRTNHFGVDAALSNTIQPGAITPTEPNSLIVSGCVADANIDSIDSGFTITDKINYVTSLAGAAAYLVQETAAAVNPTWRFVSNAGPVAVIMSFKGA